MSKKSKGFVTIPTDASYVEETKKFMELWGADAVRDCDGVKLPEDLKQFGCDVYKAYFIVREDHEYAKLHKEYRQNVALTTKRILSTGCDMKVDLLDGLFKESLEVNATEYKRFWQVIDRTTGKLHDEWEYLGGNIVEIKNPVKFHEYAVNFFAYNAWDPVQIYNYHVNGWTCEKDVDMDPVYPDALGHMLMRMEEWLKNNPDVTVVRFTTFFYNFFIVYETGYKQKIWDWHSYAMTASPAMFDLFEKETGEKMTLEDLIDGGTYSNRFVIPKPVTKKYIDFVQRKCASWAKLFVDLCHKYGKRAMMFDGDHRMGTEPYSPYFKDIGLDAVVGAPSSSVYIRQIANMTGVKYTEGRLNPYFFPNECPGDDKGTEILNWFWDSMRMAMLIKPIDRIGFGGYLRQVEHYEKLKRKITEVCDEFRDIKSAVGKASCKTKAKVAVLTFWGRQDTWMMNGVFVDDTRQGGYYYNSLIFALSVLPVDADFISFEDVKANDLSKYDVIISDGMPGTSFQGGECWKDERVLEKLRAYVYAGGGFLGVGEPSGYSFGGRYFQLSDVLGVEKEQNATNFELREQAEVKSGHFITDGIDLSKIKFNENMRDVYPLTATLLSARFDAEYPLGAKNACHADFAVNEYGKGRSVYLSGINNCEEAYLFVLRTVLWLSGKENETTVNIAENPSAHVYYYEQNGLYAICNSSATKIDTVWRDAEGKERKITLEPKEIKWIKG